MNELTNYDGAYRALALATKVDEVKDIRDKAAALQTYARQRNDTDMEAWTAKIRLRATKRIGELSRELEKSPGPGRGKRINTDVKSFSGDGKSKLQILRQAGISPMTANRCEAVAGMPDREFEDYIEAQRAKGKPVTITEVLKVVTTKRRDKKRQARRNANKKMVEKAATIDALITAGGVFSTIVVDPPWDWGDEGDIDQFGRGKPTYATMSYNDLLKLPVSKLADKDAHLYLWITNRSLPKGFALIEAWGFRYITTITWIKESIGMGNYFRGSTEHLLFGIRGSLPLARHDAGTWFAAPRGKEHSEKPTEAYKLIESCSPGPYLEMFGRKQRGQWKVWGAEIT